MPARPGHANDTAYRWIALSNTTMAVFMSALDGSIVIIALPAIFRGIHLDPLAPGKGRRDHRRRPRRVVVREVERLNPRVEIGDEFHPRINLGAHVQTAR